MRVLTGQLLLFLAVVLWYRVALLWLITIECDPMVLSSSAVVDRAEGMQSPVSWLFHEADEAHGPANEAGHVDRETDEVSGSAQSDMEAESLRGDILSCVQVEKPGEEEEVSGLEGTP